MHLPTGSGVSLITHEAAGPTFVPSRRLRLAGMALHAYTASGSVLALLIVIVAMDGNAIGALWLMLAALVIDGTDGMLARRLRVSEALPWFDGARLDDIVDYLTYAFAPMVLLWANGYLPAGWLGPALAALPLLASSYQFCRVDAKTADHFFLGFPSYWNVVAFYVVVLDLSTAITAAILLVCVVLVFVPVRYLYPSRTKAFRTTTLAITAIWLVTYAVLLVQVPDPHPVVVALSLLYLVYYGVLSVFLTVSAAQRRRAPRRSRSTAGLDGPEPAPATASGD